MKLSFYKVGFSNCKVIHVYRRKFKKKSLKEQKNLKSPILPLLKENF